MSKRKYLGTEIDRIHLQSVNRMPGYRVVIWNPNRTDIHDVVLGKAESPAYDVSHYVQRIEFTENIVFENNDDAVATNAVLVVTYDENADPVQMTPKVWLDGTPVRIYQGDLRVSRQDWIPIFTGVVRGVPTTEEDKRDLRRSATMQIICVDRAEKYLNSIVTAREYFKGIDIGKAAVETSIEWMYLDRREILIGEQGYTIEHINAQLVDIEVLKGLAQMLFTVGKKPRFDAEGFLVAADTDLDKAPVRRYETGDFVKLVKRDQVLTSVNNSVRLLGLDDEITEVVERRKRLAHGTITAGYFSEEVNEKVYFSENEQEDGGRRAKNTELGKFKISRLGDIVGENLSWIPQIERDGYTTFGGVITFDTGFAPELRVTLAVTWIALVIAAHALRTEADLDPTGAGAPAAEELENAADALLIAQLIIMSEIGTVTWSVVGEPFQNVFQQLAATAQINGILSEDIKEIEIRNDWLYDIDYMSEIVKELLRRELIKGWSYTIEMLDDPIIETDDIIDIEGRRYYITSIRKTLQRPSLEGTMKLTAWRVK